jgi:putative chitinase
MNNATFIRATRTSKGSASIWLTPITNAMNRFQINTPIRQAAFLAQVGYESGGFPLPPIAESFNYSVARLPRVFRELSPEQCLALGRQPGETSVPQARQQQLANLVYENRYGNGPASSGNGWTYRGSGLIQITFRDNFNAAGQALGIDLDTYPDLVRNDPGTAALVAAWYWQSHGCNELADTGDFDRITEKINPAMEGEPGRNDAFAVASKALGVASSSSHFTA